MKTQVSLCTPAARVVAVYVGHDPVDGGHYVAFAPAVAVAYRHDPAGGHDDHAFLLFHRDGCGVGEEHDLLQSDDEVCESLNAPWPPSDDEAQARGLVARLKRRLAARARDKAAHT